MKISQGRFESIKQSPRSACITDVEDLCDEIERLQARCRELEDEEKENTRVLINTRNMASESLSDMKARVKELEAQCLEKELINVALAIAVREWIDAARQGYDTFPQRAHAEQILTGLPQSVEKLLAVVEAAERHEMINPHSTCRCDVCEAVRAYEEPRK